MNRDSLKRLAGFGLAVGSLALVAIVWYAHLVLRRADIYHTIPATLFFGSGVLVGLVYATAERYTTRWFILDPQSLRRSQKVISAIAALLFAIGTLSWFIVRVGELNLVSGVLLALCSVFFCWIALMTFKRVFQGK
jgi:hypothetical protein